MTIIFIALNNISAVYIKVTVNFPGDLITINNYKYLKKQQKEIKKLKKIHLKKSV